LKESAAGKTLQNRARLLFHGLIRLWLRNSGLRPSDSLATVGSFRLMKLRKRSRCFAKFFSVAVFLFVFFNLSFL
jgi:hypothetical protein